MLTAVFATACSFCVGTDCPVEGDAGSDVGQINQVGDADSDSGSDLDSDEDVDVDLPSISDQTLDPELDLSDDDDSSSHSGQALDPSRDFPFPQTDTLSYVSPTLGMSFDYPSDFVYGEGSFRYWDNFTLNNSADGAVFDIHVNPDGFGPFFPDITYTVEEGSDGSLEIVLTEEIETEYSADGRTFYMFNYHASNGKNYLVMFIVDGDTREYQTAFEDFIRSFTIL